MWVNVVCDGHATLACMDQDLEGEGKWIDSDQKKEIGNNTILKQVLLHMEPALRCLKLWAFSSCGVCRTSICGVHSSDLVPLWLKSTRLTNTKSGEILMIISHGWRWRRHFVWAPTAAHCTQMDRHGAELFHPLPTNKTKDKVSISSTSYVEFMY